MRRFFILLVGLVAGIGALRSEGVGTRHQVACGTWMELRATPADDYHFVQWSDGSTEAVRQVQVNEDMLFVAYFADNCEDYANWPVVALYDWLLMLNVRAIEQMGYYLSPANVAWYRVVDAPDDMHDIFPRDDQFLTTGYYLTLGQNLVGTGDYYAVVDVSDAQGKVCDGLMRSIIIHFSGSGNRRLSLTPTSVRTGEQMHLRGLLPDETSTITVYSATGQLLETCTSADADSYVLQAAGVAGCYQVVVSSPTVHETLRYIVSGL